MSSDQVLNLILMYIRNNRNRLFNMKSDEAVDEIMNGVKRYGFLAKMYLNRYWNAIEDLMSDREKLYELIKSKDSEVYRDIIEHRDWFEEFSTKLYHALKTFLGK